MHPSALNCGSPCSAQPVAPEAVSEPPRFARLFSFCLPKVADLFGQNYQEAKTANQDSHLMMFEQSPFNAMIDSAIKKLKDSQETNQSIWEFIEESSYYKDFDGKEVRFSSQVDARLNGLGCGTFFTRIDGTEMSKEEIKALLLASKFRAQRRPLAVTRLINVADSLHVTAQEQKEAGLTSVQLLSELDRLHLSDKLGDAKSKSTIDSTTHKQLQNLFDRLIQITPDTSKEDLERLFNTYLWMTPLFESSEEFNHLRQAQGEGIDAPFNRFYQDLKKPDSTFLTLLDGEIQRKRISANQAKKEVQFLERQERSLGYLKFKKWTDPTEGLVFFDLFHMINNLTVQKPIIAWAVKWMNSSVKDQSLSSFWATMGITSLVASYVLYKVAQFFLSLAIAAVCYAFCTTAWGLATLVRDFFGEGAHWFVDWLKRGEIKDLSKKNRSAIANDDRGTVIQNQLQSHLLNCARVLGLEIAQQLKRPLRGRDVVDFKLVGQRPVRSIVEAESASSVADSTGSVGVIESSRSNARTAAQRRILRIMGHINPNLAATNIESSRSNARTVDQRRILRIMGHINPDLAATNAEYPSIEPSILPLLAKSAPLFATFLAAVSRDSKTEAASLIQRVYRGHLGRNGAKSLA